MLEASSAPACDCCEGGMDPCCLDQAFSSPSSSKCGVAANGTVGIRYGFSFGGSEISRFVNNYSPVYDRPFEPVTLTSERYVDKHLCEVLREDRVGMIKFHCTTDRKGKALLRH